MVVIIIIKNKELTELSINSGCKKVAIMMITWWSYNWVVIWLGFAVLVFVLENDIYFIHVHQ